MDKNKFLEINFDKIRRRQENEDNRKQRIFHPKTRLIGIDVNALDKQKENNIKVKEDEKVVNEIYGKYARESDNLTQLLLNEEKKHKRCLAQEIDLFRQHYQGPEGRREFDLNDPHRLKKDLPSRLRDDDPRCGISSCQKFEGENLSTSLKEKADQIKAWLDEQINEKLAKAKELADADNAYMDCLLVREKRAIELEDLEQLCRKKLCLAIDKYNKALGNEKRYEKQRLKKEEEQDNLAEIYNILMSGMMVEDPELAQSSLGKNRLIGSLYKGMSERQKEEIRLVQKLQREEKKLKKQNEKVFNHEWDRVTDAFTRIVNIMDNKIEKDQRQREVELSLENASLGVEQREKNDYMNKIVFRNKVTAAFFENFNKTAR